MGATQPADRLPCSHLKVQVHGLAVITTQGSTVSPTAPAWADKPGVNSIINLASGDNIHAQNDCVSARHPQMLKHGASTAGVCARQPPWCETAPVVPLSITDHS